LEPGKFNFFFWEKRGMFIAILKKKATQVFFFSPLCGGPQVFVCFFSAALF